MVELSKIQEREDEKMRKLLQRMASLDAQIKRHTAAQKKAARRDDTRRKIVLGGALLAAMESGTISGDVGRKLVARFVADRDLKLFEGSPLAADSTGSESTGADAPDSEIRE